MGLTDEINLFYLISEGVANIPSRNRSAILRLKFLNQNLGFKKVAFDTRRINQETEMNPRRGLQYYNRSQAFLSEATGNKVRNLSKLKNLLGELEIQYGAEPEWHDSNTRVLLSNLNKGLRTGINDGDFAESQPGVGSLDYIEELLHVRYRLAIDDISKIADFELKKIILSKDEELTFKNVNQPLISKGDITNNSHDKLLEKLFAGVKASKENPEVERTVTITIKDKIVESK